MKVLKFLLVILVIFNCSISLASENVGTNSETGPFCCEDLDREPILFFAFPAHYPAKAKRDSIEGKVVLSFIVTTKGTTRNIKVVDSSPQGVFEEFALKAAKRYRFTPGMKDGKPVEAFACIPIVFTSD